MTRLKLILWWAKYHALNVSHILQPDARTRNHIFRKMIEHDARHPTGNAPTWDAK